MVAVYVPADVATKVHVAADVPPAVRVTLGVQDDVSPDVDETPRLTGPDNPKRLVRLTVLLPDPPAVNEMDGAEMLKSMTVTGRTIELVSEPLVPVMFTVYRPVV
jgi:hypothetical protein